MVRQRIRAKFFVDSSGEVLTKSKPINFKIRKSIFVRDGSVCQFCSTTVVLFKNQARLFSGKRHGHVDHIFPRSRGGQNTESNLQLLCIHCNESKGARC